MLLAPSAHYRLLWRGQAREHRPRRRNRLATAGLVLLVVSMVGAMFVITAFLSGSTPAAAATAALTAFFVYVWFVIPLLHRRKGD